MLGRDGYCIACLIMLITALYMGRNLAGKAPCQPYRIREYYCTTMNIWWTHRDEEMARDLWTPSIPASIRHTGRADRRKDV